MKIRTSLCAGAALSVFVLAASAAQAQDTTVAWKGAPQWTNDDVQFTVRGRVLLDAVFEDVDRETGAVMYGEVPAGSVVVAGSMPSKNGINLYCAVIVKKVDAQTRSKTSINELLRD